MRGSASTGPAAVSGAHIYVYAANTAGYGAHSVSLLDASKPGVYTDGRGNYVVSGSDGSFGLTGLYSCTAGQQVYVLAQGGTPVGKAANPYLSLLTTFGACPASGDFSKQISFVSINQVSTVVTGFALSGFMTDGSHVSSSGSANAVAGVANAFAAVGNLMNIGNGSVFQYTASGTGAVPQPKINSLANVITTCSEDLTQCQALFNAVTPAGGNPPGDVVGAVLAISQNPGLNVATLFGMTGDQPFRPALTNVPNDWAIGITYYGQNMSGPYFPAVDAAGNIWVPDYGNNTITEVSALGAFLSGTNGYTGGGMVEPVQAAFDPSGDLWVTNYGGVTGSLAVVSEFNPDGTPVTSNGFQCGGKCTGLASDGQGNLWVSGNPQVAVLANSGKPLTAWSGVAMSGGIAVDSQGRGWTVSNGRKLTRLSLPGNVKQQIAETVTSATTAELSEVAIDAYDDIWFTSPTTNAVGEFYTNGNTASPAAGYTGGGLNGPVGIAVDGEGRVWVANRDGNSISAFSNTGGALSPSTGILVDGISNPRGVAVDPSGNVWVTDFTDNGITELLGAGTPVATPILPGNHGQRP